MKRFLTLFILFCSISSFSQKTSEEKPKKHTLGFFASPFAYTAWHTGYKIIPDQQKSGYRLTFTFFSPTGISYQYAIHRSVKILIGLFGTYENVLFVNLNTNTQNLYKRIDYKVNYLNIPINIKFFPSHISNSEELGGFFIQAGANFDFITQERISSFSYYQYSPSSGGGSYADNNKTSNSVGLKFNRICPTIAIGHEIVGDNITFFYGGNFQFQSVYQRNNTLEYFKNFKLSLINIGLNYRF